MKRSLLKYFNILLFLWGSFLLSQNHSLSFDGAGSYVELAPSSSLAASNNELTVESWIKVSSSNNNAHSSIFGARLGYGYVLYAGSNDINVPGAANFVIFTSDDSWNELQGNTDLRDDQWHHVAATYDGTVARLYIDGELDNEIYFNTDYLSTLDGGNYSTNIGTANHASEYFKGIIDDLAIWNRALTEQQIQSNMYTNLNGDEEGLVGYWNFNEGEGDALADLSGNGNDGNINSAIWSDDVPPILPVSGEDNSLSFSGSNQYVQIGNPFSGNKSDFTISAWIKAIPSNDSYGRPFYVHNAAYADVVGNVQNNPGSETIVFRIYEGDGSQANTQIECDFSSHMGEWTYVTLMNESNGGGNNTQKILINGEVKASTNWVGEKNWSVGFVHEGIGGPYYDDPYTFKGNISSVEIWDNSLSDEQVTSNMYSDFSGNENGLVSYWAFDETDGTIADDIGPGNNNGTVIGATWSGDSPVPPIYGCTDIYADNL
ncbi:MAG: LamG-like jellyroll fold domain-containing protein [Candidatus Neomarinimicrobiota bacterium]